jgi:hypothetical protein
MFTSRTTILSLSSSPCSWEVYSEKQASLTVTCNIYTNIFENLRMRSSPLFLHVCNITQTLYWNLSSNIYINILENLMRIRLLSACTFTQTFLGMWSCLLPPCNIYLNNFENLITTMCNIYISILENLIMRSRLLSPSRVTFTQTFLGIW